MLEGFRLMRNKAELRRHFKEVVEKIPFKRRKEASEKIFSALLDIALNYSNILSFTSLPGEIDLWRFNRFLEKEGRLILPKVEGEGLFAYSVDNIEKDLVLNRKFNLLEPDPNRCKRSDDIDLILVPGVAFDRTKNRLGYGGGYYDRFLSSFKNIPTIAVGFREQLFDGALPTEPHDIKVCKLLLT